MIDSGTLFVVATPIGNLSDISARALETLKNVDLIAAEDTRRTLQLLNHFEIKTPVVSYHQHNENGRSSELLSKIMNDGISVSVVTDAGTPCVSDPGCIIVAEARKNGLKVVAVPGASAVISALSVCGFVFNSFAFLGFFPRVKKEKEMFIDGIKTSEIDALVIYESPNRIIKALMEISKEIPNCDIFVINDITKFHEKSYFGGISEVIAQLEANENASLGEYTVVLQKKKNSDCSQVSEAELLTTEALLVDEIIKNGCSLKEAVDIVSNGNRSISKNQAYKASLNLKKVFE